MERAECSPQSAINRTRQKLEVKASREKALLPARNVKILWKALKSSCTLWGERKKVGLAPWSEH